MPRRTAPTPAAYDGETQISRFRHGVMLLKMVVFAFFKIKAV